MDPLKKKKVKRVYKKDYFKKSTEVEVKPNSEDIIKYLQNLRINIQSPCFLNNNNNNSPFKSLYFDS